MPVAVFGHARPIEYSILHDVKPTGPSLGVYNESEIPDSVVDDCGRRFVYVGVAPRRWNGQFDGDTLRPGEFILRPGLVYRIEKVKPSWLHSFFRMA
jgi:hypothetical protein